jgi:hypothetical protein
MNYGYARTSTDLTTAKPVSMSQTFRTRAVRHYTERLLSDQLG